MPKCSISPPTASTAAGITSRRSAMAEAPNTITSSAPALSTSSMARASAACSCGTRRSATMVAPAGAMRAAVILRVLSTTFGDKSRQQGRHNADLAHLIRRHVDDRLSLPGLADRLVARSGGYGKRYDLHGGDHLAFNHRLERRQRGNRHRLVDAVEPVDRVLVEHQHAGGFREQIAAAGEGAVGAHALAFHGRRDIGRGLILRHVARLEPRHDDFLDPGGL